ncbi:MAG: hypothetical protein KDK90_13520 [Leptospiraceae bacterium]|nr:hypothetical protein [Leptospiraceae bacterium]
MNNISYTHMEFYIIYLKLGRFLQADSVTNASSPMGLNHYMYTEGNPVKYRDPDGHRLSSAQGWALIGYLQGPSVGLTPEEGAMAGYAYGKGVDKKQEDKKQQARVEKAGAAAVGYSTGGGFYGAGAAIGLYNNIDLKKFWDTTFGNRGLWGYTRRGWTAFWRTYEEDWLRETTKDVLIKGICRQYGKESLECGLAYALDKKDSQKQEDNFARRRYLRSAKGDDWECSFEIDELGEKEFKCVYRGFPLPGIPLP